MSTLEHEETMSKRVHAIGLLALLTFVAWSTGGRLIGGWSADDGAHLRFSSLYSVRDFLFDSELLWIASFAHLTPILNLFYSFNLDQWGLDAAAWRVSMVVLSVATLAAFHAAAKQHMRSSLALFVSLAWALSVPFFYTAATFMTSHYMVGMLAASLCVWCYAQWVRQESWPSLLGASLLYAVAAFSKEVFLPLPGLLLLQTPWRRSALSMVPMAAVLLGYLACRHLVLGTFVGGYQRGQYLDPTNILLLVKNTAHLVLTLYGGFWQLTVVAVVVLYALWRATLPRRVFAFVAAILAVLPLLPLIGTWHLPEPDRYFFVLSAVTLFVIGLLFETTLKRHPNRPWITWAGAAAVIAVLLQQYLVRIPVLIQGFGVQASIYKLALAHPESMLILNPGLPADDSYWSHALNNIREAKARQQSQDSYQKVLVVSNPQAPIVFGLHTRNIPVYRYDAANCRCLVLYEPSGTPDTSPVSVVPQQTIQLHLPDPTSRPENNQSAWGQSTQTARRIVPNDLSTLEITGNIHLGTELDWLYLVLPFQEKAMIEPTEPAMAISTAQGELQRPFSLRLRFSTPQRAAQAHDQLCIAVPSILNSPYALLQGQPDYCKIFVNDTLRQPR